MKAIGQQDPTLRIGTDHEVTRQSYELSAEQLDTLEGELFDRLRNEVGVTTGVVCVVVSPDVELSDFGRTQESDRFREKGEDYDFFEGMRPYENRSLFLYTADVDLGKIAHCKRLVTALDETEIIETGLTGMDVFDDRVMADDESQRATLDEIKGYHGLKNFSRCLNVATNQKTRRAEQTWENPYTIISYKGVYELVISMDAECIIAYLNKFAYDSLGGLGLDAELLCGKQYNLPVAGKLAEYDFGYTAVILPRSEHNTDAFTKVDPNNEFTKLIADRTVPLYSITGNDQPIEIIVE